MLFAGDDGVKKVKVLSGGEKVRCLLSKMMISGANVLVFDEPTNHLDMESITALNNGMIKFPGVILFSSHDHQIVETTANRIMEILPNGTLIDKITTYDEYLASDVMARKRQVYTVDAAWRKKTTDRFFPAFHRTGSPLGLPVFVVRFFCLCYNKIKTD